MGKLTGTKLITDEVRMSYVHVFEPREGLDGGAAKYGVTLLIPKSNKKLIKQIEKGIEAAIAAGVEKFGKKFPKNPTTTFYDGDEAENVGEEYEDHMFLRCSSKNKPGVIKKAPAGSAANTIELTDESEFYSGCYGKASVVFGPYDANGKKGVTCFINNLLFTNDGERLAGGASAESDFEDELEDFDDEDNDPLLD